MAKGMIDPGMTAAEGGVIEKDMQKTIGLDALLEIERRTVEK